jgi:hypothetical protein
MADDKLLADLKTDLEKSGFGAELAALRLFHSAPFRATASKTYFDKVSNSQRQIDISAGHELHVINNNWIYQAELLVLAEVKKSEKPWVVFKTSTYENPYNVYLAESLIEEHNAPSRRQHETRAKLADYAVKVRGNWFGHGVHEAFKKPDDFSRWFKAASSVSRAAWANPFSRPPQQENMATVAIVHPAVILHGRLFAAASGPSFEMQLEEINRATVWHRETNSLFDRRFLIDLVVLDSLPAYITELKERLKIAHTELMKRVDLSGGTVYAT